MSQSSPSSIVAIILISKTGDLILQQRDNNPLGAAHLRGKVGFFGGHGEDNEAPKTAIAREVHEELELDVNSAATKLFGLYQKQLAVHGDSNFVHVYQYDELVDPKNLTVHEGVGYVLVNAKNMGEFLFTPFAKQLVEYLLGSSTELDRYKVD